MGEKDTGRLEDFSDGVFAIWRTRERSPSRLRIPFASKKQHKRSPPAQAGHVHGKIVLTVT
jgi:hypothetical protein